jgi:hypothetical protein
MVDCALLFGNMDEVAALSSRLLERLETATTDIDIHHQIIGQYSITGFTISAVLLVFLSKLLMWLDTVCSLYLQAHVSLISLRK